jgi:hypothetical protein
MTFSTNVQMVLRLSIFHYTGFYMHLPVLRVLKAEWHYGFLLKNDPNKLPIKLPYAGCPPVTDPF